VFLGSVAQEIPPRHEQTPEALRTLQGAEIDTNIKVE
jgi:hypothetical protein